MSIYSLGKRSVIVWLAGVALWAGNPIVTLKSMANAKYVCADNAGANPLIANRQQASGWEQFEKVDMGSGLVAFKAMANSRYVCAENGGAGALIANRQGPPSTWESFWVVDMGSGKVALKSAANNKFVCAENGGAGALIANRQGPPNTWEAFEMSEVGGGGGGMKAATSTTPFSIAVIPDSQFMVCWYQGGTPAMFERQVQWIADGVKNPNLNFVFASHVGDITDNGAQQWQWDNAKNAMRKLDGLIPYGIAPGNHDSMVMWNRDYALMNNGNFTASKFQGQSWFGGTYQGRYENNYELFGADGMEFIIVHMAYNPSAEVRAWASGVLRQYPDRRAIVATHEYLPASGGRTAIGDSIWNDVVKSNPNVFLVVCGHHHGENMVTSTNNAGGTVYQLLTDYQGDNPQIGRIRYYTFKPGENQIVVSTYATETGSYKWMCNLPYTMK